MKVSRKANQETPQAGQSIELNGLYAVCAAAVVVGRWEWSERMAMMAAVVSSSKNKSTSNVLPNFHRSIALKLLS